MTAVAHARQACRPATGGSVTSTYAYGALGEPAHGVLTVGSGTYLESVIGGPEAATFVYGADGTRLLRATTTASTLYLDGMEVTADATGTTATRYLPAVLE